MNKKHLILLALAANAHVHGAPNLRPRQSKPEPGKNTKKSIQKQIKPIQKKTNQRNAKPQSKEIAATAHVHGADNNESILGKMEDLNPSASNDLAQKQKTDQNSPEQSDISMAEQSDSDISMAEQNVTPRLRTLQQRLTTSGPIGVIPQYLTVPEALKMFSLSKDTRKKLESLGLSPVPEKYNNETQQWEKAKIGDNLDECFARCITTVLVPSIPNAIQDLPGIIGNKRVNHIKIALIDAHPNPYPRPAGWLNMVNDLFTGHNNSLTFKVVQPDNTAGGWDIESVLSSLTKVKHLIYEGKTGREKIAIIIPANVGNHIVTVGNAKRLDVAGRSVTKAKDTNARFIITGNGDNPATITANSDGALSHATLGAHYRVLTRTLTKGRCELTFGYDPIRQRDDTIRANSDDGDNRLCYTEHYTDGPDLGELHHTLEVRGKYELTVADRIMKAISNYYAMYKNHYDSRYTYFMAEACGTDNTIEVNKTHDTPIKVTSDDTVCHEFQRFGGHTMSEGEAKGNAEFSIDEANKIQLASTIESIYSYYKDTCSFGHPSQSIKTEGRSTITTWRNINATNIKGIVESKGMALHSKWDPFKGGASYNPYCQRTRASTNAELIYGDNTVKGTAQDVQYTAHHKDTLVHNVRIKGKAGFELEDNPEESKITIKGDNVDYENNDDSKHPEKPFSGRSGQCDILLEQKQPAKGFVEIHSSSTDPGSQFATKSRRLECSDWADRLLASFNNR